MTLTLEEVKNIRFPMARRPNEGYRANEVDDFVDRAVDTFQSMADENERLKAQLDAVSADQGARGGDDQQVAQLRAELERLQKENNSLREAAAAGQQAGSGVDEGELNRLRQANAELEQKAGDLGRQLSAAQAAQVAQPSVGVQNAKLERLVVTTSAEASPAVIRLVQLATEQAESVVSEAESTARTKRAEAERAAEETTKAAQERAAKIDTDAKQNAERLTTEARNQAERVTSEAKSNADQVNVDASKRREELFSTLETERDHFVGKIDELKAWEANYRTSLTEHLRKQAEAVESSKLAPKDAPALVDGDRSASATPRLDALLADKN